MVNLKAAIENLPTSAAQLKVETGSTGVSYVSGLLAAFGGTWTKNEILAAGGLIFVAATYFTSLYFQRRRDRREQEFHTLRVQSELAAREQCRAELERENP